MNVLFDLDGTLTDPKTGILGCIRHALEVLGKPCPPERELVGAIGPPLRETFAELGVGDPAAVERAVAAYRDRFTSVGMFENEVYHGIPELLAALREGRARLFVATSKPQVFAEQILAHFGLAHHFDAVFGSELDGARSDKGALIQWLLRTANLAAEDCIMVGDREHDIRGAKANGVRSVGVRWGYGTREELQRAGAHHLIERPDELLTMTGLARPPTRPVG